MVENLKDIYNTWDKIDEKSEENITEEQVGGAFQKYRRTAEEYGENSDEAKGEHANWMKIKKELAIQEGWDKKTENEEEPEFIDIEKEDLNIKEEPEYIDIEKDNITEEIEKEIEKQDAGAIEELEKLSPKEKKSLVEGITDWGYKATKVKADMFDKTFKKAAKLSQKNDVLRKLFNKYAQKNREQSKFAQRQLDTAGKGVIGKGVGALKGGAMLLKLGRVLSDFKYINPYRHATGISMLAGKALEGGKEVRLESDTVKEKNWLNLDEAFEEAEKLKDKLQRTSADGKLDANELCKAYRDQLPEDIKSRLAKGEWQGTRFYKHLFEKDAAGKIDRIEKKIEKINNSNLSDEKKKIKIDNYMQRQSKLLDDLDGMISKTGIADRGAYYLRMGEKVGKGVASALMVDSLYRIAKSGIEYSGFAEKFFRDKESTDDIEYNKIGVINSIKDHDAARHPDDAWGESDSDQPSTGLKKVANIPHPDEFDKPLGKEPGGVKPFRGVEREPSAAEMEALSQRDTENMGRGPSSKDFQDSIAGQDINDAKSISNYDQGMDRRGSTIDLTEAEKAAGTEQAENPFTASDMPEKTTLDMATVKENEGVSHAVMRQLAGGDVTGESYEANEEHLRNMGYKGDINNQEAIEKWARNESGKIVSQEEYYNKSANKQTWVMQPDKSAYVLYGNKDTGFHIGEYHRAGAGEDFEFRGLEKHPESIAEGYEKEHEIKSPIQHKGDSIKSHLEDAVKTVDGLHKPEASVDKLVESAAKDVVNEKLAKIYGSQIYEYKGWTDDEGGSGRTGIGDIDATNIMNNDFGEPYDHPGYEKDPHLKMSNYDDRAKAVSAFDWAEQDNRKELLEYFNEAKEYLGETPAKGESVNDYLNRYEQQRILDENFGTSATEVEPSAAAEQIVQSVASKSDLVVIDPEKNILSVFDKRGNSSREFTLPKGITVTEQVQQNPKNLFVDIRYGDNNVLSGKLFFTANDGGILKLDAGTKEVDIREFFDNLDKSSEPEKVIGDYATDTKSHFGVDENTGDLETNKTVEQLDNELDESLKDFDKEMENNKSLEEITGEQEPQEQETDTEKNKQIDEFVNKADSFIVKNKVELYDAIISNDTKYLTGLNLGDVKPIGDGRIEIVYPADHPLEKLVIDYNEKYISIDNANERIPWKYDKSINSVEDLRNFINNNLVEKISNSN